MSFSFRDLFSLRKSNPITIINVVMEFDGMHIEANFYSRQITCRRIISPAEADGYFPDGYFDPHRAVIDTGSLAQLNKRLWECMQNLPFETEPVLLPFGATQDAYMRFRDRNGNQYYYFTSRPTKDGFSVESIPVHREFRELFQLLLSQCSFHG